MEEGSQDLLGVTVNPGGVAQLRRLTNATRWTFIGGILLNGLYVLNSLIQRFTITNIESWRKTNPPFYIELKLHLWYIIVFSGLSISQAYTLWLFSRRSSAACERADDDRFNESLQLINRFNRIAQLAVLIAFLFGLLETWSSLNFWAIRNPN